MKKLSLSQSATIAFVIGVVGVVAAIAHEKSGSDEPPVYSSIRVDHHVDRAALSSIARISFAEALAIASKAASGAVIKGELEVEDHNLMYSFDVVTINRVVMEVEIDAGNGKILSVDRD